MKKLLVLFSVLMVSLASQAEPFGKGQLTIRKIAKNAVRIQYTEEQPMEALPEWIYVKNDEVADAKIAVSVNQKGILNVSDQQGNVVFTATSHHLRKVMVAGINGTDDTKALDCRLDFIGTFSKATCFADSGSSAEPWKISTVSSFPSSVVCQPRGGFVYVIQK